MVEFCRHLQNKTILTFVLPSRMKFALKFEVVTDRTQASAGESIRNTKNPISLVARYLEPCVHPPAENHIFIFLDTCILCINMIR